MTRFITHRRKIPASLNQSRLYNKKKGVFGEF
jgi:hypothetical protein